MEEVYVCLFPAREDYLMWLQACMGRVEVISTSDVEPCVLVMWKPVK